MTKSFRMIGAEGALFECWAPDAEAVFLAGTFNNWDPKATPMERAGDGTWHCKLKLPPGQHEFRFVVDGQWRCDPESDDQADPTRVPDLLGTMNNMIDIPMPDERDIAQEVLAADKTLDY